MTLAEFKYLAANRTEGLITFGNYVTQLYWAQGYAAPGFLSYGNEIIILFNNYPGNIVRVDAIGLKLTDYTLELLEQVTAIDINIPGVGPIQNIQTIDSDVGAHFFIISSLFGCFIKQKNFSCYRKVFIFCLVVKV